MFVDELTIFAQAGAGGNGVERWRQEKYKPKAGPSGGDGGRGGDVFVEAVKDLNYLSKYTGNKEFYAGNGGHGQKNSLEGKAGEDIVIQVPVGSRITDVERGRSFELLTVGARERILKGGRGGYGNEHFKSSTNVSPTETTPGTPGESGNFLIEVSLVVDVGFIGLPNAGKSTLLNTLTNARSKIGAYPFTTLEPHLGDLYGITLADIPGLIAGAAAGKGLGHKFLRHVARTKMLLHLVSLESADPAGDYYIIREELKAFSTTLLDKEEWIILTKKDLVNQDKIDTVLKDLAKTENRVFVISEEDADSIKKLRDALVSHVRDTYNSD